MLKIERDRALGQFSDYVVVMREIDCSARLFVGSFYHCLQYAKRYGCDYRF